MINAVSQQSKILFNEVAIADLHPFQIAVLTTTRTVGQHALSAKTSGLKRTYQSQGWLIYNEQEVACFDGLKIGTNSSEISPFKPIQRLAPSIPISFVVKGSQPLPQPISAQAVLACQLPDVDFPYHTIFCQLRPRFVRIYSLDANFSLLSKVQQMLADETLFISQNHEQLKQVSFYQEYFGL